MLGNRQESSPAKGGLMIQSKEIYLKAVPEGLPKLSDFGLRTVALAEPKDGEVAVRNLWMSVDPYMRLLLGAPAPMGVPVDAVLQGGAVGQVVESRFNGLNNGDYVLSNMGWREFAVGKASKFETIDHMLAPPSSFLGALGMPGITAYFGLLDVGQLKDGDAVFVSAAGGAIGQIVCQLAKAHGCYVVGSAGSDEKCRWLLEEAKVDVAINYKTCGDLETAVGNAFPKGIDLYFSNVSGAHLDAAFAHMNRFGRIAFCGLVDSYNDSAPPPGLKNLKAIMTKSLTIRGFNASSYFSQTGLFRSEMGKLIKAGKMKWEETVKDGLENAPDAFLGLFSGQNRGKMIVKVG